MEPEEPSNLAAAALSSRLISIIVREDNCVGYRITH